jgi:hypothetical protein
MSKLLLALLLAPAAYVVRGFGHLQAPWESKVVGKYCGGTAGGASPYFSYEYTGNDGECPSGFDGQAAAAICSSNPSSLPVGWEKDNEEGAEYGDSFDFVEIYTDDDNLSCYVYCYTNCDCMTSGIDLESTIYSNGAAFPDLECEGDR